MQDGFEINANTLVFVNDHSLTVPLEMRGGHVSPSESALKPHSVVGVWGIKHPELSQTVPPVLTQS